MDNKTTVLELDQQHYIGEGSNRLCYRHPENPQLCIKIVTKSHTKRKDQNLKEFSYYNFLQKKDIFWDRIAKCYGWTQTSLGKGLVFELIRDKNNQPLPNLEEQLKANTLAPEEIAQELQALIDSIMTSAIIVADLSLANIVYNPDKVKGKRLILVDGVSNRNFFKLANYVPFMARHKMKRTWKRFCIKHLHRYGINMG